MAKIKLKIVERQTTVSRETVREAMTYVVGKAGGSGKPNSVVKEKSFSKKDK